MATQRKPAKKPVARPAVKKGAARPKPSRKPAPAAKAAKPVRPAAKAPKPAPRSAARTPARASRPAATAAKGAKAVVGAKGAVKPAPVKGAGARSAPPKSVATKTPPAKGAKLPPAKPGAKQPPGRAGTKAAADAKVAAAAPRPIGRLVPARHLPGKTPPPGTKQGSGKYKLVPRPPAEVRPLGVLPPEAMVRTRERQKPVAPPRPAPRAAVAPRAVKGDMETPKLTKDVLQHFEQRLLSERARIMKEMGHLETTILKVNPRDSAGELSGYSFHMADAGTDSMERELSFDIASKEGRLLREIDDALRRIYNGVYGMCEASGKPIARARLEALPWARYTVEEQEKLEREQRAGRVPKDD